MAFTFDRDRQFAIDSGARAKQKAKMRIGGNGRALGRIQTATDYRDESFVPSFRPAPAVSSGMAVNQRTPAGQYFCSGCRRRATYLIRQPRTAVRSLLCQECHDKR